MPSLIYPCLMSFDKIGDPYGTRTRVTAVKGRCLNRLTNGPVKYKSVISCLIIVCSSDARTFCNMAESEGFEPSRPRKRPTRFPIVLLRPTRTALHGSTGRIRTCDRSVNSRLLYH